MSKYIDLNYRPRSYFWAAELGIQLSSDIKGSVRKELAEHLLDKNIDELSEFINKPKLSAEERNITGKIHPILMGGEYLPDWFENEVEIARISINSVTGDVVCVYARQTNEGIAYRVVDEYDGDTLNDDEQPVTKSPMTLGELTDYFMETWDLFGVLYMNFVEYGDEVEMAHMFIADASSSFYRQFGEFIDQKVDAWVKEHTTKE